MMIFVAAVFLCMATTLAVPKATRARYRREGDAFLARYLEPPVAVGLIGAAAFSIGTYAHAAAGWLAFIIGAAVYLFRHYSVTLPRLAAELAPRAVGQGDIATIATPGLRYPIGTPVRVLREAENSVLVRHAHCDWRPYIVVRPHELNGITHDRWHD